MGFICTVSIAPFFLLLKIFWFLKCDHKVWYEWYAREIRCSFLWTGKKKSFKVQHVVHIDNVLWKQQQQQMEFQTNQDIIINLSISRVWIICIYMNEALNELLLLSSRKSIAPHTNMYHWWYANNGIHRAMIIAIFTCGAFDKSEMQIYDQQIDLWKHVNNTSANRRLITDQSSHAIAYVSDVVVLKFDAACCAPIIRNALKMCALIRFRLPAHVSWRFSMIRPYELKCVLIVILNADRIQILRLYRYILFHSYRALLSK